MLSLLCFRCIVCNVYNYLLQMEGSDYINANFISSPLRNHNFIAAQVNQKFDVELDVNIMV